VAGTVFDKLLLQLQFFLASKFGSKKNYNLVISKLKLKAKVLPKP